jgi:release factor glutamine methyltransferase
MAAVLGIPPGRLTLAAREPLPPDAASALAGLVDERRRFRPVAQIIGRRAFWGRDFTVTADVLDPRPETETLVAAALAGPAPCRILDLGTGSGALLVTLLAEWPRATGLGTDVSPAALAVAATNAQFHGVGARARFALADWTDGLAGVFDLVVSNPPYIAAAELDRLAPDVRDWEPRAALTPGATGLEAYRRLAVGLAAVLAPGGRALFEIGAGQGPVVAALFEAAGHGTVRLQADLDGRDRVLAIGPV